MSVKEIRGLYSAAPFRAFDIILTNRTRVLVDHPEFITFARIFEPYMSRSEMAV